VSREVVARPLRALDPLHAATATAAAIRSSFADRVARARQRWNLGSWNTNDLRQIARLRRNLRAGLMQTKGSRPTRSVV
jgi:hypothetical protein